MKNMDFNSVSRLGSPFRQGTEVLAKRPEGSASYICTHHGTFHADEARQRCRHVKIYKAHMI